MEIVLEGAARMAEAIPTSLGNGRPVVVQAVPIPFPSDAQPAENDEVPPIDLSGLEGRWRATRRDFSGYGHCCCQRWISIERNIWMHPQSGDLEGNEIVRVTLCGICPGTNYGHLKERRGNTLYWWSTRLQREEHYVSESLANVTTNAEDVGTTMGTVKVSRQNEIEFEEESIDGQAIPQIGCQLLAAHTKLTLRYQGPPKLPGWRHRPGAPMMMGASMERA
jgi:hypothetical protein